MIKNLWVTLVLLGSFTCGSIQASADAKDITNKTGKVSSEQNLNEIWTIIQNVVWDSKIGVYAFENSKADLEGRLDGLSRAEFTLKFKRDDYTIGTLSERLQTMKASILCIKYEKGKLAEEEAVALGIIRKIEKVLNEKEKAAAQKDAVAVRLHGIAEGIDLEILRDDQKDFEKYVSEEWPKHSITAADLDVPFYYADKANWTLRTLLENRRRICVERLRSARDGEETEIFLTWTDRVIRIQKLCGIEEPALPQKKWTDHRKALLTGLAAGALTLVFCVAYVALTGRRTVTKTPAPVKGA